MTTSGIIIMVFSVTTVTMLFVGCVWRVFSAPEDEDNQSEPSSKRDR